MSGDLEPRLRPQTTRQTHNGVVILGVVRLVDEHNRCRYILALNRDEWAAVEAERSRVPLLFGEWVWVTLDEAEAQVRSVLGIGFQPVT